MSELLQAPVLIAGIVCVLAIAVAILVVSRRRARRAAILPAAALPDTAMSAGARLPAHEPSPSVPRRLSAGVSQASSWTWAVGCAFQPIFFSWAPKERPGEGASTRKAEMPFGPSPPVRAMTR